MKRKQQMSNHTVVPSSRFMVKRDGDDLLSPAGPAMLVSPVSPSGEGPLAKRLRMALLENPLPSAVSNTTDCTSTTVDGDASSSAPSTPARNSMSEVKPEPSSPPQDHPSPSSSPQPPSDGRSTPVSSPDPMLPGVFSGVCEENLVELASAAALTLFPKGLGVAYAADSGELSFIPRPNVDMALHTLPPQPSPPQLLSPQQLSPQPQPYGYHSTSFFGEASTLTLSTSLPPTPPSLTPAPISYTHNTVTTTTALYEPFFSAAPSQSVIAHIDSILAPHTSRTAAKRTPKKTTAATNKPKAPRTRTRRPNKPKVPGAAPKASYNPLTRSMPASMPSVQTPVMPYRPPALGSIAAFISDVIDDTPFSTTPYNYYTPSRNTSATRYTSLPSIVQPPVSPPSSLAFPATAYDEEHDLIRQQQQQLDTLLPSPALGSTPTMESFDFSKWLSTTTRGSASSTSSSLSWATLCDFPLPPSC